MKIAQVAVGLDGFRCAGHEFQEERLALFERVLEHAHGHSCDLLVLPAGFWYAPTKLEYTRHLYRIIGKAKDKVAIVGGIDTEFVAETEDQSLGIFALGITGETMPTLQIRPRLRSFGFACSADQTIFHWQQVSTTNKDCERVQPDKNQPIQLSRRTISAPRDDEAWTVLALTCGEMHNRHIRKLLQVAPNRFTAVVISGHNGLGQGLVQSLTAVSKAAGKKGSFCPVVHAQHLASLQSSLHFIDTKGRHHSNCVGDCLLGRVGVNWAAVVIRKIFE